MARGLVLALAAALSPLTACASVPPPASYEAELAELRAREEIRELIHAYGRTLDARDFAGFAELWAEDAEYFGGPDGTAVRGPQAIASFLENIFAANPSGLEGPTAHLFFNEHIVVDGERAQGESLGGFAAEGEGGAEMVILARYEDAYVLEDGRWKFSSRAVVGLIPGPRR